MTLFATSMFLTDLRNTGEEGLDVNVGVVHFEVVVSQSAGHTNGGHHTGLQIRKTHTWRIIRKIVVQ